MYFANRQLTNTNPILLGVARTKESKLTTKEIIGLSNLDILAEFCRAHGLHLRVCGDLPALAGILGSGAPMSNSPCPICPATRHRITVDKKQVLQNDLEFHLRVQESR